MLVFWQVLIASIATVASSPTVYHQGQSGKTNVRVELKDAVIIVVGDGELGGDYDYNYDYSDLTIKPSPPTASTSIPTTATGVPANPTTPKITTVAPVSTANPNITQNAAVVLEAENNSIIFPANNFKPGSASAEPIKIKPSDFYKPDQIPVVVLQESQNPNKFLPVQTVEKQVISTGSQSEKTSTVSAKELLLRHCSTGFYLDDRNRCKRIRRPSRERPQLPIGLRFDHKPLTRS